MEASYRLKPVCRELNRSRYRIEQWITARLWVPSVETTKGSARLITFSDAADIEIRARLSDLGISPHMMPDRFNLYRLKAGASLLVVTGRKLVEIIPATARGARGTRVGEGIPARVPARSNFEIMSAEDLLKRINDRGVKFLAIVNLDHVHDQVAAAWDRLAESGGK